MHNRLMDSSEPTGPSLQYNACEIAEDEKQSYLEHQICLFGPERYESRYEYPLVVWLHSCGSSEMELEQVMPSLSLQNYVACAPRGTEPCNVDGTLFRWGKSEASAAIAEELVFDTIEAATSQFSIAKNRIFLAGFGSGGTMAWRLALRYPEHFAGLISICGDYPHQAHALTRLAEARELKTLWMFGEQAEACGITQVCETLPVLHAASLAVDIRQYPCGDELLTNMLEDVNGWLMEQVTNQKANVIEIAEESFSSN